MHQGLAQSLQMESLEVGIFVHKPGEDLEGHKSGRTMRRAVAAELDRAHPATKVALADRLDLQVRRKLHGGNCGLLAAESVLQAPVLACAFLTSAASTALFLALPPRG